MQYANVDVMCIAPSHLSTSTSTTNTNTTNTIQSEETSQAEKTFCAICKVEVNAKTATTHPKSVEDIIVLPCKHVYHYTCLRNTCIYTNPGTYAKECPLCRHKYTSFDVPTDDVYVPYFHKKLKHTTNKHKSVDWDTITEGTHLFVSSTASKYKCQTVVYKKQTKCQATVQLADGTITRFAKTNLYSTILISPST